MAIKEDLAAIVGAANVADDPEVLRKYSRDYSLVTPRMPSWVVYAKSVPEIQGVVKYANERKIPVTPRSSRVSFYGAGIPSQGGIILDLTGMSKILQIDARNKKVKVEPGVTWAQVQDELGKQGLMVSSPFLPHPEKSVVTSALEREPILITKSEYSEVFVNGEIVLANGDLFWTGTAMAKGMKDQVFTEGLIPGTKLFLGAQGTLGIVTWAHLKAEFIPTRDKVFFIACDNASDIAEPIYSIQRKMLGSECLVLNRFNLAAILAEKMPDDFKSLREALPPYTIIQVLSGMHRLPDERIAYEEKALTGIASELHFELQRNVGGIAGLDSKILGMLRKPWSFSGKDGYWKLRPKGGCHEVFFHATMERIPEFTAALTQIATAYGYPVDDIGIYFQPLERARMGFYQYSFHCNPEDAREVDKVRKLYLEASERVVNMGGLFTTPYGAWRIWSTAGRRPTRRL